jgi:hypothetical protein
MLTTIEAYLTLRRATGFAMSNAEYLLKSFAAFAAGRGQTHVHTQTAIDWATLGPSVAQRDARLKAVCRFVRHVRVDDARHELPPSNHFGARKRRRPPHIYSAQEIDHLIEAALGVDLPRPHLAARAAVTRRRHDLNIELQAPYPQLSAKLALHPRPTDPSRWRAEPHAFGHDRRATRPLGLVTWGRQRPACCMHHRLPPAPAAGVAK